MTGLILFEESKKAMKLLKKGYALSVIMNVDDFEKFHQKNYKNMLGFGEDYKNTMHCTILSEIGNMQGHYVVLGRNEIVPGLHGDIFYIDPDDL